MRIERYISIFDSSEISIFKLVSVAELVCLSFTQLETQTTDFLTTRPMYLNNLKTLIYKIIYKHVSQYIITCLDSFGTFNKKSYFLTCEQTLIM